MRRSERLKYLRVIYNLSQNELANELGVTRNYLSQLENEKLAFSENKFNEIVNCIYRCGEEKRKNAFAEILLGE